MIRLGIMGRSHPVFQLGVLGPTALRLNRCGIWGLYSVIKALAVTYLVHVIVGILV